MIMSEIHICIVLVSLQIQSTSSFDSPAIPEVSYQHPFIGEQIEMWGNCVTRSENVTAGM